MLEPRSRPNILRLLPFAPDRPGAGACLIVDEPQELQGLDEPDLAPHRKPHMLHPHRARAQLLQRVDINLDKGPPRARRVPHPPRFDCLTLAQQQLRRLALRQFLQLRLERHQARLAGEDFLDARTQRRPVLLGYRKVPAQIQQRDLTHSARDAFGAHQAVRQVRLPGRVVASAHASYEHAGASIERKSQRGRSAAKYYGTTKRFAESPVKESGTYVRLPGLLRKIVLKMG